MGYGTVFVIFFKGRGLEPPLGGGLIFFGIGRVLYITLNIKFRVCWIITLGFMKFYLSGRRGGLRVAPGGKAGADFFWSRKWVVYDYTWKV